MTLVFTFLTLLAVLLHLSVRAAYASNPNFIFIPVDDMGYADLGPSPGQTGTLASLSYANGHLNARTLKEAVCIGKWRTARSAAST